MDLIMDWWDGRNEKGKKFILLVIVALCASALAVVFGNRVAGIFALICVHIFWGYYSTEDPGPIALAFVYGIIIFIILSWWIPGVEKFGSAGMKITRTFVKNAGENAEAVANDYEAGKKPQAQQQSAPVVPVTPATPAPSVSAPVAPVVPQAQAEQPTNNGFEIDLDERWSEEIAIPPGSRSDFWCSARGAEVVMFYSGGTSSYPSGVPFKCTTKDDEEIKRGSNLRNLRLSFRSFVPGVTATVTH